MVEIKFMCDGAQSRTIHFAELSKHSYLMIIGRSVDEGVNFCPWAMIKRLWKASSPSIMQKLKKYNNKNE